MSKYLQLLLLNVFYQSHFAHSQQKHYSYPKPSYYFIKCSVFDVWPCMMCSKQHQYCWKYMIFRTKTKALFKKKLLLNSLNKGIFNTHGIKSRGRLLRASWKILMSKGIKHIKQNAFNSLKKNIKPCNFLIKEYYLCSTTYMNFAQLFALICVQMGNYHSNHGVRKHSCSILNI